MDIGSRRRRLLTATAAGTAAFALLVGCASTTGSAGGATDTSVGSSEAESSEPANPAGTDDPGDTATVVEPSEDPAEPTRTVFAELTSPPAAFSPASADSFDDYEMVGLLFATLFSRDDNSTLVGNLATAWDSSSPSDYTVTIRDDAVCADGTPITASVVADSLQYLADTGGGSATAVFGEGAPTIAADDATSTVTIATAAPYTDLPTALTMPQSGIMCPAGIADPAGAEAGTVPGAFSGPYTLGDVSPGVSYTFNLRPDYTTWPDFATPLPGRAPTVIQFGISTDAATTVNKLLAGQLDLGRVTADNVPRFDGTDFNKVNSLQAITYVLFNERPGRFFADNEAARKAVAQAMDREQYNKVFSNGASPVYSTVAPPDYACVLDDPTLIPAHDPDAAAAVLDGVTVNMIASNAFAEKGAEYITQVLTDAGATVKLDLSDNTTWATKLHDVNNNWDLTIKGDIPQLGVISDSLQRVIGAPLEDGGRNETSSDNPEGEKALAAGLGTTDPAAKCASYEEAQRTVLQRMDVIPLAGVVRDVVSSPDVTIRAPGGRPNNATIRIVG